MLDDPDDSIASGQLQPARGKGRWRAVGLGLLLALPIEVLLFQTWIAGNHELWREVEEEYGVPALQIELDRGYDYFRTKAATEHPELSRSEHERIAFDDWDRSRQRYDKTSREAIRAGSARYNARQTRFIIYCLVAGLISLALPFAIKRLSTPTE